MDFEGILVVLNHAFYWTVVVNNLKWPSNSLKLMLRLTKKREKIFESKLVEN